MDETLSYDAFNRLVGYSGAGGSPAAQYTYDAFGRRIQKIVVDGSGAVTTRYVYHGDRVIEEMNEAGTTLAASYVHGTDIDEVLRMRRDTDGAGGPEDYYYHTDDLFNVVALTDQTGAVVERYDYGDYGAPEIYDDAGTPRAASAYANTRLFQGRDYDAETGLYYFRARYLDPLTGRFTTRDPLGIWADVLNLGNGYTYAGNNPWSMRDPFGLESGGNQKSWWESLLSAGAALVDGLVGGVTFGIAQPFSGYHDIYGSHLDNVAYTAGELGSLLVPLNWLKVLKPVLGPAFKWAGRLANEAGLLERIYEGLRRLAGLLGLLGESPVDDLAADIGGGLDDLFPPGALDDLASAGVAARKGFKPFTRSNFRENLARLSGKIPPNSQAHHIFPIALEGDFAAVGIKIHDPRFGAWWEVSSHQANWWQYNQRWVKFFERDRTIDEVYVFGRELAREFGLVTYF